MRLPALPAFSPDSHELPLWPPLLASRGPGARSDLHAHHAMHLVLALDGELKTRASRTGPWVSSAGVLTAPDVAHAIDALGVDVLIVFLDPESAAGAALSELQRGSLRAIDAGERAALLGAADPRAIMRADGAEWTRTVLQTLGGLQVAPRAVHPRVRRLLRLMRSSEQRDASLAALAQAVGLSPGRLMHVFTESIGIPLRPYIAWLKLQRAAAAVVSGMPLAAAAQAAGFTDAPHMSRTFRRMLGTTPSQLRPGRASGSAAAQLRQ